MKKNLLVTGGAGFIGSNLVLYLLKKYPDYQIVNLDKMTYAANAANLAGAEKQKNYHFVEGDICNRKLIEQIFKEHKINLVMHLAAESHVDNSIEDPGVFVVTNVNGTFTLIDVARSMWLDENLKYKAEYEGARFLHVSTDEVYGTLGPTGLFTETTSYAPNSPYSASKASSDMIVRSYHHTYGLDTVITNCSNNYGPRQHKEKLIPTIIRSALAHRPIPIYGDGKNVRDWLYVEDHCLGVDLAAHKGRAGETYNIGGNNEKENIYIAQTICELLDKKASAEKKDLGSFKDLITFVKDKPGHDFRYAIDAEKIRTELGWQPAENFETGIAKTIDWYLANRQFIVD